MKLRFLIPIVVVILFGLILMPIRDENNKSKKLLTISNDISTVTEQVRNYSLPKYMGSALDPEKKISKVLLIIDRKKITNEFFREIIQNYISSIDALASHNDWEKEFKAFHFKIEEMAGGKEPSIVAERLPGSTVITWNKAW
ncbi:MAG: hypothetical protein N2645_19060 [Clostridia bacterium]|nr:hypothetical protein [Clostridia bacterium]